MTEIKERCHAENDCELVAELYTNISRMQQELSALREQARWIPVTERLPEIGQEVEAIIPEKGICVTTYELNWRWNFRPATHWRSLPAPEVEK